MNYRKIVILLFFLLLPVSVYAEKPYFSLDVAKNASSHNNLGLLRLEDGYYDLAIGEFQLAIDLSPETKARATYYNNLGMAYMKIGCYKEAQSAFESAIKITPLVFSYYQNVVQSYKMQGILPSKIQQYQQIEGTNSLYMVMLGLCYIENGDIKKGIIKLDEFCMQEPYLITTSGVKKYLKELTEQFY